VVDEHYVERAALGQEGDEVEGGGPVAVVGVEEEAEQGGCGGDGGWE
jgi:hypothetical protein